LETIDENSGLIILFYGISEARDDTFMMLWAEFDGKIGKIKNALAPANGHACSGMPRRQFVPHL